MSSPLLEADITSRYGAGVPVLDRVRFSIQHGEILGLVGQSGSGKSTVALSLLRLLGYRGGRQSGSVRFKNRDLLSLSEREMRQIRGREIGFVPQSPAAALNPLLQLRTHLEEAWRAHSAAKIQSFRDVLENVSLPCNEAFLSSYPAQISVGQGQRFLIAMAILHSPALLIADEPTSALDVITQAEILKLFRALNREQKIAILYISHDLLSVASLCDRVAILECGRLVEMGETRQIFREPQEPYTQRLVAAIPRNPWEENHRVP